MKHSMRRLLLACLMTTALAAHGFDLQGPQGSGSFGAIVKALPSGNFVVADPSAGPVSNAGAVYLYDSDGNLISAVRGDRENDAVGSAAIIVLDDGNFLIVSPCWHGDSVNENGAVTWVDGRLGVSGTLSSSNSLIGTHVFGTCSVPGQTFGVVPLPGGEYHILSGAWTDDAAVPYKGAFLWARAGSGVTGTMSAANSLVGSHAHDGDGLSAVVLANGNIVVGNSSWSSDDTRFVGAVTLFTPTSRPVGFVSSSNSLVGSSYGDGVSLAVIPLANGNYVASFPFWSRGSDAQVGAVIWGDGHSGAHGVVSEQNALVGRQANDSVGFGGITPLTNGNFVIASLGFQGDDGRDIGAATWANGTQPSVGEVSPTNSLTGSVDGDGDGVSVVALSNGNYVVQNLSWANGGVANAGAVTWADGTRPTSAIVSTSNSLVGTVEGESVGRVTALTNGNYVVSVSTYDDNRGAVRWMSGSAGSSGTWSATDAIVGASPGDGIGMVIALTDGNYVVDSPLWANGVHYQVGAVTWADGTRPTQATVGALNSLIGSSDSDRVGGCEDHTYCPNVTALAHGAYFVSSPSWTDGDVESVGAVTWLAGHGPSSSVVSKANSLTGASAQERFGYATPAVFADGTVIFWSPDFSGGYGVVAPRVLGGSAVGVIGSGDNDVRGHAYGGGINLVFDYDASRGVLIVGDPGSNFVTTRQIARSSTFGHSQHQKPMR